MPRQRPASVTAAAILALIYGGVFSCCSVIGIASVAGQGALQQFAGGGDPQQAELQKQIQEIMDREVPGYRVSQIVGPIISLVVSLTFLIAGVGLLGMQSWARLLAIVAALFTVVFNLFQSIYQVIFVFPALNQVFTVALPNAMAKGPGPAPPPGIMDVMKTAMWMGIVVGILIQVAVIVYLLIIVFLLLRSNVRAAFAGRGPTAAEGHSEAVEEDEGWGKSAPRRKSEDDFRIQ